MPFFPHGTSLASAQNFSEHNDPVVLLMRRQLQDMEVLLERLRAMKGQLRPDHARYFELLAEYETDMERVQQGINNARMYLNG